MIMRAPKMLHCLRPFVESMHWDYCVVWKLGDDPSRFLEWVGCCCSGAFVVAKEEEENGVDQDLPPLCKDVHVLHHVRAMACEKLADFPCSIPLCSGSRGDAVILNEPKWLIHGDASNSEPSDELNGTQVLIPVVGGLVELYTSRLIPDDQRTIECVSSMFKLYVEETMNEKSSFSNRSIQGSSTGSTPASTEHLQCDSPTKLAFLNGLFEHSIDLFKENAKLQCSQNPTRRKNNDFSESFVSYGTATNDIMNSQKRQRAQYRSKNLVTERNRRNRIKDGLFTLRSLVPKITKMDRAAIVGDAINYIKELEESVKEYKDKLNEIDAEDCCQIKAEPVTPDLDPKHEVSEQTPEKTESSFIIINKVHVKVNQIGERLFNIRFNGKYSRGGFSRLLEIMDSLGLQVLDANVTTLDTEVLSIFTAEAKSNGLCDSRKLEYALVELTI